MNLFVTAPARRTIGALAVVLACTALAACGAGGGSDAATTTTIAAGAATTTTTVAATTTSAVETTTETPTTAAPTTAAPTAPPATAPADPALDAADAEARIKSTGDWAPDMSTYDAGATLSAVEATVSGAGSAASPEQLFFFNRGRYLGTATSTPRVASAITGSSDDTVTVSYGNFQPTDPFCCPSLEPYVVTFRWNGTKVVPEGTLPPEGQGLS